MRVTEGTETGTVGDVSASATPLELVLCPQNIEARTYFHAQKQTIQFIGKRLNAFGTLK